MKKIVVISDTHGNKQALAKLSDIMFESDYVFHLGDCYDDFTDYALPVKKGDRLSVVKVTSRGIIAKKDGVTGWYYGKIKE